MHRRERLAGRFDRTVALPVEIDAERVKAECRNGILGVLLPRAERDKPKLRHIAANPRVALALRTDEIGDEITVVSGDAVVDASLPSADAVPDYVAKYAGLIADMGSAPGPFAGEYSVPIRITPTKLRQWPAGGE